MSQKLKSRHLKTSFWVVVNFFKNHKQETFLLFILGILSAIGNGAVPYITGKLFDSLIDPSQVLFIEEFKFPTVFLILIALAILQIILAIFDYFKYIRQSQIEFMARFEYVANSYSKLLFLPISFHKTKKMGEVESAISNAGWGLQTLIGRLVSSFGAELITAVVATLIIFFINPYIAFFTLSGLVIFIGLSTSMLIKTGDLENKFMSTWGKAFGIASDSVNNIVAIKQATAEQYEKQKIQNSFMKKLLPLWVRSDDIWANLQFYQRMVIVIVQIIVFIWSIKLVIAGIMTIGELIAFNAYLGMIFGPFVSILSMSKTLQSGLININVVEKILSVPTENYTPQKQDIAKNIEGGIEFKDISFSYTKNTKVVQNINFKVEPGQTIALVGESGVGKSTLIELLSAYYLTSKGKILIDGIDIKKIDLKLLRSNISVVPQEVVLFNDTILTNIKYGNFKATKEEVREAAQKAHALSFIEKFPKKWKQLVGERGVKLSVGQKQRVAIARAILRDPKILILDEPTSALDAKSEKVIQDSLEELMRGRTTFIVAHRLSTVRKADLILVFEDGKIVEKGKHQDLMQITNGKYRHLYELQIGLHT